MSVDCVFCDGQDNTFAEGELWRARWDLYPATPGHAGIVPRRHVALLEELNEHEIDEMMRFAREAMSVIRRSDLTGMYRMLAERSDDHMRVLQQKAMTSLALHSSPPDAFNLGINDGPIAGQSVPHLHLHLMPRWEGDMENPRGGVRNLFPEDTYKEGL
ncbi:MAG: HIT domain-containing protein [Candidatus Saccharimonadales bacterium]